MEYLSIDPVKTEKKYIPIRNYNYNCFSLMKSYLPINTFTLFLNSLIEYKLKNIWNSVVIHWIQMQKKMDKRNKEIYKKSVYSKQKYNYIHHNIDDEELNDLLNHFIDEDHFKAMFVLLCIQKDFHI
tara:strand:- start:1257 stop:1637 length:381 start_codon:yes stop_codon:yes gene_type:complete